MKRVERLLRSYPEAWRARYGEEYVAFLEDELADGRSVLRLGLSVVIGGVREQAHAAGLVGDATSDAERVRAGSLVVLWAWAAFVIGGCALAKQAEHAGAGRWLAVVQALAVASGLFVVAGAGLVVPSAARFVRDGGLLAVRGSVLRAAATTLVAVGALAALVGWADALPARQVEAGEGSYGLAFVAVGLLVAATFALWLAVASAIVRRIDLPPKVLRVERLLATVVCSVMVAATGAAAAWASAAAGRSVAQLGAIGALFVVADLVALGGVGRARAA